MSDKSEKREVPLVSETKVYLTLDEANALIPRIEPLVRRMVNLARDLLVRYERLSGLPAARRERHPLYKEELADIEAGVRRDVERLKSFVEELAALGAITKSPVEGIVDFYCRHEDRDIFLCWRLGEPQIEFWHEIDAGFAGRRPVCELFESSSASRE